MNSPRKTIIAEGLPLRGDANRRRSSERGPATAEQPLQPAARCLVLPGEAPHFGSIAGRALKPMQSSAPRHQLEEPILCTESAALCTMRQSAGRR